MLSTQTHQGVARRRKHISCLPDGLTSRSSRVGQRQALISALMQKKVSLIMHNVLKKKACGGWRPRDHPSCLQHLLSSWTVSQLSVCILQNAHIFPSYQLTARPSGGGLGSACLQRGNVLLLKRYQGNAESRLTAATTTWDLQAPEGPCS